MKLEKLFIFFLLLCFLGSCKKSNEQKKPESFNDIFEKFWHGMSQNYVFWDIDKTNWDSLYIEYKPRFAKLSVSNDEDVKKSVSYFRDLTKNLIDSHLNIAFESPALSDSIINPSLERYLRANINHNPYDFSTLTYKYFDKGWMVSNFLFEENGHQQLLYSSFAKISGKILYFSCSRFKLSEAVKENHIPTKNIIDSLVYNINKTDYDLKGVIIDLRGNSGGDTEDLQFLLSKLIGEKVEFGYYKYKNGNGRLDFTPELPAIVLPGLKRPEVPIIALVNNHSASLSETMAFAIHALPKGKVIGERTWGATGNIAGNEIYGYGSFNVDGFLKIEMSSSNFRYKNGKSYEGTGFSPDIAVPFNLSLYQIGRDNQLENAIEVLNSEH